MRMDDIQPAAQTALKTHALYVNAQLKTENRNMTQVRTMLISCALCNGDPVYCRDKCKHRCRPGERAVELLNAGDTGGELSKKRRRALTPEQFAAASARGRKASLESRKGDEKGMWFTDEQGQKRYVTTEQMRENDEREGRSRVPASIIDAIIGLCGALQLLENDNKLIERTARQYDLWRCFRVAEGNLRKGIEGLTRKISTRQALSIRENTTDLNICVSARPSAMCVNIPVAACDVLVDHALSYCANECLCNEAEARKCPLRDVLSSIPGMQKEDDGIGLCPYMGCKHG